tara:strand:+ start:640 stop:762 length:123 start_codon:yes stop_codon:yes gene_type:complete
MVERLRAAGSGLGARACRRGVMKLQVFQEGQIADAVWDLS